MCGRTRHGIDRRRDRREVLQAEGVEYVFAIPAGRSFSFTTSCSSRTRSSISWCATSRARRMLLTATRARATSRCGVGDLGPGVTNAVTGIATAYMDSIPMVIITGQVPTHAIGLDAFQECDTVGITRPCVKHNFLVKEVKDLAVTIKKAFYLARTGRPGPVLVDIPRTSRQPSAHSSTRRR